MKNEDCIVKFSVEKTASEVFDYLVIRNPVYGIMNDWEYKNGDIKKRLEDPLDYPDGHLSLLTIKRYIEGLSEKLVGKTKFGYYEDSQEMLWFESKLPIVKKEDNQ